MNTVSSVGSSSETSRTVNPPACRHLDHAGSSPALLWTVSCTVSPRTAVLVTPSMSRRCAASRSRLVAGLDPDDGVAADRAP